MFNLLKRFFLFILILNFNSFLVGDQNNYGLEILSPTVFLFATAIITAIVSLATGSSWSTIATIGIALLAIGTAIGLPLGLIGGAIISGAYFGDKMSPLSETTNMAAAISGVDLFDHIKYMMYTTVPSFIITLIIFLGIGFYFTTDISPEQIEKATKDWFKYLK